MTAVVVVTLLVVMVNLLFDFLSANPNVERNMDMLRLLLLGVGSSEQGLGEVCKEVPNIE